MLLTRITEIRDIKQEETGHYKCITSPACEHQGGPNSWLDNDISNYRYQHALFVKLTPSSCRSQCAQLIEHLKKLDNGTTRRLSFILQSIITNFSFH